MSDPERVDVDDVLNSGGRDLSEHDDPGARDDGNDQPIREWWETY